MRSATSPPWWWCWSPACWCSSELGISIAPILATAGVAGIAIAFGAQSLIKDYFTGFFLLIEDQIRQGDVVEIAGKSGEVEEVTLRYVRLRDGDGYVHFVPNGEIKLVTNRTRGLRPRGDRRGVASSQKVEDAFQAMRDVGAELRQDPAVRPRTSWATSRSRASSAGSSCGVFAALPDESRCRAEQWRRAARIHAPPEERVRAAGDKSPEHLVDAPHPVGQRGGARAAGCRPT